MLACCKHGRALVVHARASRYGRVVPSSRASRKQRRMAAQAATRELIVHGRSGTTVRAKERDRLRNRAANVLRSAGVRGVHRDSVAQRLELSTGSARRLLNDLVAQGRATHQADKDRYYHREQSRGGGRASRAPARPVRLLGESLERNESKIVNCLLRAGTSMSVESLRSRFPAKAADGVDKAIARLSASGIVKVAFQDGARVSLTDAAYRELTPG
jgi:hypothetical protein